MQSTPLAAERVDRIELMFEHRPFLGAEVHSAHIALIKSNAVYALVMLGESNVQVGDNCLDVAFHVTASLKQQYRVLL